MKLKSFDDLKKCGIIYHVFESGKICVNNGRGSWMIIDETWFNVEVEISDKKVINQELFNAFNKMFEE